MILLIALLAGLAAGFLFARLQHRSWTVPPLLTPGLALLAFLPQVLVAWLPPVRDLLPDGLVVAGLFLSLALLLLFCWINRHLSGVWIMALGLGLNLLVMAFNGGFMPISPQAASRLVPADTQAALAALASGTRFGLKDILLLPSQTHLVLLSDLLLSPKGFPYQVAFSLGDVLIAAGVFWLMVSQGKPLPSLLNIPTQKHKMKMTKESQC
jgi:hypothetical protein